MKKNVLILVVIALLLRLIYVCFVAVNPPTHDGSVYHKLAIGLLDGPPWFDAEYASRRAPLYPIFVATIYWFAGPSYFVVKLIQVLLSSLLVLVIFKLGRLLFNQQTAFLAAAITAIYPFYIYYTGLLLTESLFLFLLTCAVLLLIKGVDEMRLSLIMGSAIVLGLATLTRPVSGLLVFIFILWLLFLPLGRIQKVRYAMVIFVFYIAMIAPWTMRNFIVLRGFIPFTTEGGFQFYASNNPLAKGSGVYESAIYKQFKEKYGEIQRQYPDEIERQKYLYKEGLSFIVQTPGKFLRLCGQKCIRFWNIFPLHELRYKLISFFSYGILFPFFILGFFKTLSHSDKKVLLLHFIIIYFTLIHSIFSYGSLRFRLPLEPYIILLASFMIIKLGHRLFPHTQTS